MTDTEHTDPTQGDETQPEAPEPEAPEETPDEHAEEHEGPGREAAKYRRRLRDTETERDTLATTVETLQRAEVERLAGSTLAKPQGLWASGVELGDLIADDGTVDAGAVTEAATAAVDTLGLARPNRGNHVPREGNNPGTVATGDRMAAALDGLR